MQRCGCVGPQWHDEAAERPAAVLVHVEAVVPTDERAETQGGGRASRSVESAVAGRQ